MEPAAPQIPLPPAEVALSLLFKKLHPILEDAAHALQQKASAKDLTKLHERLVRARHQAVEAIEAEVEGLPEGELQELLDTLAANLTPMGETFPQSLILTQLCLEEAPKDLLIHVAPGRVSEAPWGARMVGFLQKLEDPAFQARARWAEVDETIGETEEG